MLHHVSIEVAPADLERMVSMWRALGFDEVRVPDPLGEGIRWVEREGTQVHLIETPEPTAPALGHAAVVVPGFAQALRRLEAEGFGVEPARELWGEKRAFVSAPGGHRVEVMAAPPP